MEPAAVEVRAFASGMAVSEDPVTGSLNTGLVQWLIGAGRLPVRYTAAQGTALGRAGRVHLEQDVCDPATLWAGGQCVTVLQGTAGLCPDRRETP